MKSPGKWYPCISSLFLPSLLCPLAAPWGPSVTQVPTNQISYSLPLRCLRACLTSTPSLCVHDLLPQDRPPKDPVPWVPYRFSSPREPNVIVFPGEGEEAEAGSRERHGDLEMDPPPTPGLVVKGPGF